MRIEKHNESLLVSYEGPDDLRAVALSCEEVARLGNHPNARLIGFIGQGACRTESTYDSVPPMILNGDYARLTLDALSLWGNSSSRQTDTPDPNSELRARAREMAGDHVPPTFSPRKNRLIARLRRLAVSA